MFRARKRPVEPPRWLFAGLGNPGPEYRGSRHNIGFEVIDALAERSRIKLDRSRHHARYGQGIIAEEPVVLAKPLTYMNLSGRSVAPLLREFGLKPEALLVIADDLDLPIGRTRLRVQGSAGGHNGHKSIIQAIGTDEYPRLKIGIGKQGTTIDHVLGPFTREERTLINEAIHRSVRGIEILLREGLSAGMNYLNGDQS